MFKFIFFDFETLALKNKEVLYNRRFIVKDFPIYHALPREVSMVKITTNKNFVQESIESMHLNIIPQKGIINYRNIIDNDIDEKSKTFYMQNNNSKTFDWMKPDSIVLKHALQKIHSFVKPYSPDTTVLIAHNGLRFDFLLLDLLYKRFKYPCFLTNCLFFDTCNYAYKRFGNKRSCKLVDLFKDLTGKEIQNAHSSESDTHALIEVAGKLCGDLRTLVYNSTPYTINTYDDITHIGNETLADKLFLNNFATWPSVVYNKTYMQLNFLTDEEKNFLNERYVDLF